MRRNVWILLSWSPQYGAPTTAVGVLGLDVALDGSVDAFVEWLPRQYEAAMTWRARIAGTSPAELPSQMELWENSATTPAAAVLPLSDDGLALAVQLQVDDLLAAG